MGMFDKAKDYRKKLKRAGGRSHTAGDSDSAKEPFKDPEKHAKKNISSVSPGAKVAEKLYKEIRGATGKDLEDEAKKQQKRQKREIKRQRIIEQTRAAEAESEVSLRRHRMQSRQYGRRSLLGG